MSESKIDNRLWSSKARNLSPYVPGEQPQHDNLCKLNTNENPFPPSPKVGEAIAKVLTQQAQELRLYPAPESNDLRAALAQAYDLDVSQVFVGNGSDEVLALIFASFFLKERPLLSPDIGYSFYPVYAQTFGVHLVKIPLEEDFSIDPDAYRQPCSGIIIANPNAPAKAAADKLAPSQISFDLRFQSALFNALFFQKFGDGVLRGAEAFGKTLNLALNLVPLNADFHPSGFLQLQLFIHKFAQRLFAQPLDSFA